MRQGQTFALSLSSYIFHESSCAEEDPSLAEYRNMIPYKAIFSLGILLIELGVNQPFTYSRLASQRTQDAGSFLNLLHEAQVKLDEVYRLAGDSYAYTAQRCVQFDFKGQQTQKDFGVPSFRQQFYNDVVAPVEATYHTLRN